MDIPSQLNNPFSSFLPEIAKIAAREFQEFIAEESKTWQHDFTSQKGKMFGVLVVKLQDEQYGYLGTVSGKLPGNDVCSLFVPSIFDDATDNFFINKGMTELTELSNKIKNTCDPAKIQHLKATRHQKSTALQQRLFENYNILSLSGEKKNLIQIFEQQSHSYPPTAAGECTAPKLLHFAFDNQLEPIAIAEFWWGNPIKTEAKQHKAFYPACKDRCRPILEFMLQDKQLYERGMTHE